MELKKRFLWASVGAIGFAGLMSAGLFLFGDFGETEMKLIGSTLTLGWFGLTASLAMQMEGEKPALRVAGELYFRLNDLQSWLAALVAVLGAVVFLHLIWGERSWPAIRIASSLLSLSFALSWIALLRSREMTHNAVKVCSAVSIVLVVAIEFMVLFLILREGWVEREQFFRVLAALTVLAVSGSLALPFLRKITKQEPTAPQN